MEKIDLDALLKKNPHLDAEEIRRAKKRKKPTRSATRDPSPPYGGKRARRTGDEGWADSVNIEHRPHYRGI
jgi:hypothetical protein